MPRTRAAALLIALATAGCSPTFNWREVRAGPGGLQALLPCKPENGARRVGIAGRDVELAVTGCDTGGATFAILQADIGDAGRADEVLAHWNRATLAHMKATSSRARPFAPPGATASAAAQRVSAQGSRADGSAVRGEAAYFARGSHVYQAVVYANEPRPEWVQPFFEGLKFR